MRVMVPYSLQDVGRKDSIEKIVERLRQLNADEIVLTYTETIETHEEKAEILKKYMPKFKENGIDVTVWFAPTFWAKGLNFKGESTKIKDIDGNEYSAFCPLDDRQLKYFTECVKGILSVGVKRILLEDDLRIHMPGSKVSCFCEHHMALYKELLGEDVTEEIMKKHIFDSAPNRYREAWIKGCQAAISRFAKAVREAADSIDENIEVVPCHGPSLWGADGTSGIALCEEFAGKNQKEARLIGAPYWENMFKNEINNLMSPIDFTRHQAHECKKHGIVTIAEGDPYPRPRHFCPSSFNEIFHTVMIADGNFDKIMKYGLDYVSSSDYETGYADAAEENKELYKDIERIFSDKEPVGIHLVEPFDKIFYTHDVNTFPEKEVIVSPSREFLNANSIPAIFEPNGVNLIFGENARHFDKDILKNGTILDISAAKILKENGIDVGFEAFEEALVEPLDINVGNYDYFYDENERTKLTDGMTPYVFEFKEGVKVLSEFHIYEKTYVSSYIYENKDHERFLVFGFDAKKCRAKHEIFKNYCRQHQLVAYHEWLCGEKLDAVCMNNPDLYMMVKKNDEAMAIGLWNHFADKITHPVIELKEEYKSAEFINCKGHIEGKKVILDSVLYAYEYCFINLKK